MNPFKLQIFNQIRTIFMGLAHSTHERGTATRTRMSFAHLQLSSYLALSETLERCATLSGLSSKYLNSAPGPYNSPKTTSYSNPKPSL